MKVEIRISSNHINVFPLLHLVLSSRYFVLCLELLSSMHVWSLETGCFLKHDITTTLGLIQVTVTDFNKKNNNIDDTTVSDVII